MSILSGNASQWNQWSFKFARNKAYSILKAVIRILFLKVFSEDTSWQHKASFAAWKSHFLSLVYSICTASWMRLKLVSLSKNPLVLHFKVSFIYSACFLQKYYRHYLWDQWDINIVLNMLIVRFQRTFFGIIFACLIRFDLHRATLFNVDQTFNINRMKTIAHNSDSFLIIHIRSRIKFYLLSTWHTEVY